METENIFYRNKRSAINSAIWPFFLIAALGYWFVLFYESIPSILAYFFNLPLIIIFLALYFIRFGFEFDVENQRYREVIFVFNMRYGKWNDIINPKHIIIFRANVVTGFLGRGGARISTTDKVIFVKLIYENNRSLDVYRTEDISIALDKAKYISEKLNLEIVDGNQKKHSNWKKR